MINSLIISLVLTIIIELLTSYIIGIRNKNDMLIVLLANIITNPVVVYIANMVKLFSNTIVYVIVVGIMEVIVVIVEWKIFEQYMEKKNIKKLFLSILNNVISFSIGCIINIIF